MNLSNLCYLWTFVLSLTNIIGLTDLSWFTVLGPTVFLLIITSIIIIAAVVAVVAKDTK